MIAAEITISCESIRKGCTFLARLYDLTTQQFYSGTGATALEALAWCLDDYLARVVYGFPPSPALPSDATPGSRFAALHVPTATPPKARRKRKAA